ncbi:MAG TPA: Rrf2 family transcriptional regulator [Polyangia bacterium]|nr:Rrf2 family transcriptional regulator [Polyangia bacterium]
MQTVSMKARYALRALYALADDENRSPVLIADLAERQRIPRKFLEAILLELRNAGLLQSKKGKGGGYALAKPPTEITIGQVMRAIDGPLAPIPCVSERAYVRCETCPSEETCGTHLVMKEVRDAIAKVLDGTTLASVQQRVAHASLRAVTAVAYSI